MKKIVFHLLVLMLCWGIINGGCSSSAYDSAVMDTLISLDCPAFLELISIDCYASYEVIKESQLELKEQWKIEDIGTIELWAGSKDYLAILRRDNNVYIAQYINHGQMEGSYQQEGWDESIYYHEMNTNGSGIQASIKGAFFADGNGGIFIRLTSFYAYEFKEELGLLGLTDTELDESILSLYKEVMQFQGFK